jgi:hypothetical protein
MRGNSKWVPFGVVVFLAAPFVVGFGLDEGELKCEQAAVALEECCPQALFAPDSCRQVSGCQTKTEGTLVTMAESQCLKDASCESIQAKDVCNRLAKRLELSGMGGGGPSIEELHAEDSLCDGL